ncbi:MAG: phosphoenolpyruvate carboxykinase (GTP) [Candidatus Altiarchaeota archaeon]
MASLNAPKVLTEKTSAENLAKLKELKNPHVIELVAKYVEHLNPESVFMCDDSPEDLAYLAEAAVINGEEKRLATEGHTIHFDNYLDQARDKANTKILLSPGESISKNINTMDREEGLSEIHDVLAGIMEGREMYVLFRTLAPPGSIFSIPCIQLTDSAYVCHNELLLFRPGYEEMKKLQGSDEFFRFIHSQGELTEAKCSANLEKRRVYIDLDGSTVYSANNQYGGNSIGPKKHAMRLAIYEASKSDWLCEHMFIMGVHGSSDRVTYFAGAYPSACGKTSTAMVPGETIVGDDIAYFRIVNGKAMAANVEKGMFGIIQDVNAEGDPTIFNALTSPGEVIFSNVLIDETGNARWLGDGRSEPTEGVNHSGDWTKGKTGPDGKEVTASHKNARYTIAISTLENMDPKIDDPEGVALGGLIYGGRDSDTSVPVVQSFDWDHGVLTIGSTLESETTAATLGQEGVRKFNIMSNMDFLSVPLSKYINMNLEFGERADNPPLIFGSNYFLKGKDGKYLNAIADKRVWLKWMAARVHGELDAIETPVGFIPKYADLARLFKEVLDKDYSQEDYDAQFTIRVPHLLAKIERMKEVYAKVPDVPAKLTKALADQEERLKEAQEKHGDYIKPGVLE